MSLGLVYLLDFAGEHEVLVVAGQNVPELKQAEVAARLRNHLATRDQVVLKQWSQTALSYASVFSGKMEPEVLNKSA